MLLVYVVIVLYCLALFLECVPSTQLTVRQSQTSLSGIQKKAWLSQQVTAPCLLLCLQDLPVRQVVEMEDSDIDDPDPL